MLRFGLVFRLAAGAHAPGKRSHFCCPLCSQVNATVQEHAELYRQCGLECVRAVASFYRRDMELFGFSLPEGV